MFDPSFVGDPYATALKYWQKGGRRPAPNGALMRTAILGLWEHHSTEIVVENTVTVCKITHADPRCVASCIALTLAIRLLVTSDVGLETIIPQILPYAEQYDSGVKDVLVKAYSSTIDELELDALDSRGYTYKTLEGAFWALFHGASIDDGLYAVINAGGDADTNGAVAGALLGAKFGFGYPII